MKVATVIERRTIDQSILMGVVAEQPLHRELLSAPLKQISGAKVLLSARSARELLPLTHTNPIHFAIVWCDGNMGRGIDNLRALRDAAPTLRTIAVGVDPERSAFMRCLEAGAVGCVTRNEGLRSFLQMVVDHCDGRAACKGNVLDSVIERIRELQCRAMPAVAKPSLSKREIEILGCVGRGQLNKEIAAGLEIEVPTVKNHVHRVLQKLGARTRGEAVRLASVHGIFTKDEGPAPVETARGTMRGLSRVAERVNRS